MHRKMVNKNRIHHINNGRKKRSLYCLFYPSVMHSPLFLHLLRSVFYAIMLLVDTVMCYLRARLHGDNNSNNNIESKRMTAEKHDVFELS